MRILHSAIPLIVLGLGALAACGEKSATNTVASAQPVVEEVAKKELASLVMPAEVVAVFGSDDPRKVLGQLTKIIATVQPGGKSLEEQLVPGIADAFFLTSTDGFDLAKPVRFAMLDPKKRKDAAPVFAMHVSTKEKLLATLPPSKAENIENNQWSWDANGRKVFMNLDGDVAFLTMAADVFTTHKPFLRELGASTISGEAVSIINLDHISTLYSADIDAMVAQVKSQAELIKDENMKNGLAMMEGFASILKDLDTATVTLGVPDDGVVAKFAFRPKKGTSLATSFAALKSAGDPKFLSKLPKNAPVALIGSLSPEAFPLLEKYLDWYGAMNPAGGMLKGLMGAAKDSWSAMTGEFAFALFTQPDIEGVNIVALSGVKDADKMREAYRKMAGAADSEDFKKAGDQLGLKMTFDKGAYKVGDVEIDVQKSEFTKAPPQMQAMMSWFSETHYGVAKTESALAYGPNAKKTLTAYFDGKIAGGFSESPLWLRAKKNAVSDPLFLFLASPSEVMKLAGAPEMPGAPPADAAPLAISAGAKDGVIEVVLDIPSVQIAPTANGFMMLQMYMMKAAMGDGAGHDHAGHDHPGAKKPKPVLIKPN